MSFTSPTNENFSGLQALACGQLYRNTHDDKVTSTLVLAAFRDFHKAEQLRLQANLQYPITLRRGSRRRRSRQLEVRSLLQGYMKTSEVSKPSLVLNLHHDTHKTRSLPRSYLLHVGSFVRSSNSNFSPISDSSERR